MTDATQNAPTPPGFCPICGDFVPRGMAHECAWRQSPIGYLRKILGAYDEGNWRTGGELLTAFPEKLLRALLAEREQLEQALREIISLKGHVALKALRCRRIAKAALGEPLPPYPDRLPPPPEAP